MDISLEKKQLFSDHHVTLFVIFFIASRNILHESSLVLTSLESSLDDSRLLTSLSRVCLVKVQGLNPLSAPSRLVVDAGNSRVLRPDLTRFLNFHN